MVIPKLKHPFPFRTRQLRASGSMVLVSQGIGRVDRCQHWFLESSNKGFHIKKFVAVVLFGLSGAVSLQASEIGASADVMEAKKWSLTVVGRSVEVEPTVTLSNTNAVQVNTTGGPVSVFAGSNADVEMTQEFESALAVIRYRPHDGLTYRLKAGVIRDFQIEFSSGGHSNKLEDTGEGFIWGLGGSWNVYPGTIVSPAITLDLGFTQSRSSLDKFTSPGVGSAVDHTFTQDEIQGSINVSKRFKQVEPYAGLAISRVISKLKDGVTKDTVRGEDDFVIPFVGVAAEMFPGEKVFIEASFLDEEAFNAGFAINF